MTGTFEQAVVAKAQRFDLLALLSLLMSRGYAREQIVFESNAESSASEALVQAVRFKSVPSPTVTITLNFGLLAQDSLLPSYFFQVAEADPERFAAFIRFFDHELIDTFVAAVAPHLPGGLYRDYARVKRSYFRMLGVGSASTLHWLMAAYFPELRVLVSRAALRDSTTSHGFRAGMSSLDGTGILGQRYDTDAQGFGVRLFAEDETNDDGHTWAHVVRDRLRRAVLPLLQAFNVPLVVDLTVLSHASWASLDQQGYLGYERIRGDEEAGHRIVIFRGMTGVDAVTPAASQ